MLKAKSLNFARTLAEKNIINEQDIEIVSHGITVGIRLCINTVLTLMLGAVLGMAFESVFFIIMFSAVRSYAGGFHFEKPLFCYIMSSAAIILSLLIAKSVPSDYIGLLNIVLSAASMTVLLRFAPIGTASKPLDDKEKVFFRKKAIRNSLIEIIMAVILFALNMKVYSFIVVLAVTLSTVLVAVQLVYLKLTE